MKNGLLIYLCLVAVAVGPPYCVLQLNNAGHDTAGEVVTWIWGILFVLYCLINWRGGGNIEGRGPDDSDGGG